MPALKPAEFGEIYIPGFWNNTFGCAPSIFLSEYNYGNSFYSFEAGLVHFIFLNPYTPSHNTSKQYQFVRDDLLSVNRANTPWIVVLTHCPFYSSNKAHFNENQTVAMKVKKQLFYFYLDLLLLFSLLSLLSCIISIF
jgi:acid phosphatase type 7